MVKKILRAGSEKKDAKDENSKAEELLLYISEDITSSRLPCKTNYGSLD